jgi:antitoxin HicB
MKALGYHIVLAPDDNDTFLVTCPDLPEVSTFGEDRDDAMLRAADAIGEALAARMAHRRDIPEPSIQDGPFVPLEAAEALKVRVYQALQSSGIKRSELARRLGQHAPQVDRLFDLRHASRIDQLDAALRTVGKRLVFDIEDAA